MINLKLDITKKEMKEMSTKIIRAIKKAVIVHVLTFAIDKPEGQLFGETVLRKFLYIVISMVIFNLITKRLFVIE